MTSTVRLLGPPHVMCGGQTLAPPRGRKPWALLALVLASQGPMPRCRVRHLLFPDAEDPQAALRWTLSQARRATGGAVELAGDPLCWRLTAGTCVDVLDVLAGRPPLAWPAAEAVLPLLEGADPDVAEFGAWLVGRRRAVRAAGARLAHRARACSPARRSVVLELVRLGEQVMDGGAAADGTRILAEAVRRARTLDDDAVLADALAHYGTGVVHAVASTHPAAAAALREAAVRARSTGSSATAALAHRELGFVAAAGGDLPAALRALATAEAAAADRPDRLAGVHYVRGFALVDAGRSAEALAELDTAVALAADADRPRQLASAFAIRGRARLQRGEDGLAAEDVTAARTLVDELAWTALRPWVDSLAAEVAVRAGHLDEADGLLRDARTLAEVLRDDCWLALSSRGLATLHASRGRPAEAVAELSATVDAFAGSPDACLWIEMSIRDAFCASAVDVDPAAALRAAHELTALAERTGLVEYATRAAVHRARLGDRDAVAEARARASGQGNPALGRLVAGVGG